MVRQLLADLYLDYFNNFLTRERFAEHYGLSAQQADGVLVIGKEIHDEDSQGTANPA